MHLHYFPLQFIVHTFILAVSGFPVSSFKKAMVDEAADETAEAEAFKAETLYNLVTNKGTLNGLTFER